MITKLFFTICSVFVISSAASQNSIMWATYFGGPGGDYTNEYYDKIIATDDSGNVYIAGYTNGITGIASGVFQNSYGGGAFDAYLAKYNPSGNLLWSTYYGGEGTDFGYNVTTDAAGNVFLSGYTNSITGIASGGFQNTFSGGPNDAFLVKFDSDGNRLWSTYYGGPSDEELWAVATDISGNVYIAGQTCSSSGIASGGFQNTTTGCDAFLVKFNTSGSRLWATYYGGSTGGEQATSIATDASENVYLAGYTNCIPDVAFGSFQNGITNTAADAMLIKFDSSGNGIWARYFGGTGTEEAHSVSTDEAGNVYITGNTDSQLGIATGGFQNSFGGGLNDVFLAKYNGVGNLLWATYYGGDGFEWGNSVVTSSGKVYLSGVTTSTSNITLGGFQNAYGGGFYDAFLVEFDSVGNRNCATYYGGSLNEWGGLVTTDGSGNVYLAGYTSSTSGIASGGFQNSFGGGFSDAFIVKFKSSSTASVNEMDNSMNLIISPNPFSTETTLHTTEFLNNATLVVENYLGQRVVKIDNIMGQSVIINRENLASGLYLISLTQESKIIATGKLLVTD
jgi:hypothetical protein